MAQELMLAIGGVFTAVLNLLVGGGCKQWILWFTQRLLALAVRRLPETQQERFAEEWHSHLNDVQGEVRKVLFAWGCASAARDMAASFTDRRTNIGLVWKGTIERLRAWKRSFVNATVLIAFEKTPTGAMNAHTLVLERKHVTVGPTRPDGKPHPHAGKTGRIVRFINIYSDPQWLGPPSAMIKLDSPIEGFIWVSLTSLEVLPELVLTAEPSHACQWVRSR
jgi:hypothetical protein